MQTLHVYNPISVYVLSIAVLISRVRSRWVKKYAKLSTRFATNTSFWPSLPSLFGVGGTKPEQYKTTCQMTKSTGNRNSADSHNCTNAQSQSREISPDQKQAEKGAVERQPFHFCRSSFSFRVFRFMIRVSEGGHERVYRMTPHSMCIYTYTY